jgi:hypothetical protein
MDALESEYDTDSDCEDVDLNDIESLKRDNEMKERELEMLIEQNNFHKYCTNNLNEMTMAIKGKEAYEEKRKAKINEKTAELKNSLKSLNQNISKSLIEFHSKFGNEEKLNRFYLSDIEEFELDMDGYLNNEKDLLEKIQNLISYEVNLSDVQQDLNGSIVNNELRQNTEFRNENNKCENVANILKILAKNYPVSIHDQFMCKLEYEMTKFDLDSMNHVIQFKDKIFEYSQEELQSNPNLTAKIENKIKEYECQIELLKSEYEPLSEKIKSTIDLLANLKMVSIVNMDMDRKFIEYKLFQSKQDKLIRFLTWQKSRIEYLVYLENMKLNETSNFKQIFQDLIADFNFISPPNSTINNFEQNSTLMASSKVNKNYNESFSASLANILSSTMINNNSNSNFSNASNYTNYSSSTFISSPNRFSSSNKSRLSTNPYADFQISSKQDNKYDNQDSAFIHLMNQFLISVLTKFESEGLNHQLFSLKKPISINFNDNLENFIHLYNLVHSAYTMNKTSMIKPHIDSLYKLIQESVDYLYDSDGKETNNVKKICIKRGKDLQRPFTKLHENVTELEQAFIQRVLQKYNNYNSQLEENKLLKVRRNLFVDFYTNPQKLEYLMEQINAMQSDY